MPYIVAFVAFIGSVAFFLWRLNIGIKAGRELHDEVRGLGRCLTWGRKASVVDRLADVTDPREAATILMLAVARAEGDVTTAQRVTIQAQMTAEFGMTASAADEMIAQCLWRSQGLADATGRMRALLAPVFAECSEEEIQHLRDMLEAVAASHSAPSNLQLEILQKFDRVCQERS